MKKYIIAFLIIFVLAYNMLYILTYSADYSTITISESEYSEIIKVVAGESQSDTPEAQRAVVETIFNRCADSRFPDTPYEVVSQKGQFSIWKIRNASWIEPAYGAFALNSVLNTNTNTVLPSQDYVIFSTKPQTYGYDYIKIGKTYFGKLKQ